MGFNDIKNIIGNDLVKYNSVDKRNLTNQKRDSFMEISFIVFILLLLGKISCLLLLKYE
jgi:hypothetical protein